MNKILMSAACIAAFGAAPALAQDGGSPWDISGTFGVVSDYIFRGVSQTGGDAAIQGSITVSHDSGFYGTVWGSNVDFSPLDNETDFEVDFTLGYGGAISDNTTYDVNVTYYAYPNEPNNSDYGYFEIIGGITHDLGNGLSLGLTAAYSPDNFDETGDAFYIGGNATYAVAEWISVSANIGYQLYDDAFFGNDDSYLHYDIGATVYYGILGFDVRYTATDSDVYGKDKIVGSAIFSF